jgi:hypothetical protein
MKKEKDLLSRGVVEDFRQVYEDGYFPKEVTFEQFLETHAYFITVKFHLNRMTRGQDPAQLLFEFGKYYFQIVKAAYGNRLNRTLAPWSRRACRRSRRSPEDRRRTPRSPRRLLPRLSLDYRGVCSCYVPMAIETLVKPL